MRRVKGRVARPPKATLYSPEGVGKTTLASGLPNAIFVDADQGGDELDIDRLVVDSWNSGDSSVLSAMSWIYQNHKEEGITHVVVDTLTRVQAMLFETAASHFNVTNISEIDFGKAHDWAANEFEELLYAASGLVRQGVSVWLLAHAEVVRFDDPDGSGWDRWQMSLHKKIAPKVKAWSDMILRIEHDKAVSEQKEAFGRKRQVAKSWGERLIHTDWSAQGDAKNRYGFPPQLPFYSREEGGVLVPDAERTVREIYERIAAHYAKGEELTPPAKRSTTTKAAKKED